MDIYIDVYKRIVNSVPDIPPEIGGILGKSNNIVSHVKFDKGLTYAGKRQCAYIPNTELLNRYIDEWERKHIDFCGIFHTHFFGVDTLSNGDKKYIKKIMNALPMGIFSLYFPIVVLPEHTIKVYVAYKTNQSIKILGEEIKVVNMVD